MFVICDQGRNAPPRPGLPDPKNYKSGVGGRSAKAQQLKMQN